jgi:hypothetical protein
MKAKGPKPTTKPEREAVGDCILRMIDEMQGVEDLYIGYESGVFYFEWGLFDEFDFAEGATLDEAYTAARHKVAGTEPTPF